MNSTTEIYDVLIIGGGVVGLSIAWELAQQGASVAVVDRQDMGREASWAAAGMLPPGPTIELSPHCSAYDQLQGMSHRLQPVWHEKLLNKTGIDNGFRRTGAIYVATDRESLKLRITEWTSWGIDFHELDQRTITDVEPSLKPQSNMFFIPEESQLRPPWHLKALVSACQSSGVTLKPHCEVLGWQTSAGKIDAAVTPHGKITAKQFCLTSGSWTGYLATGLGLNLPIRPIRGQILLFAGPPNTVQNIVNAGPRYITPRPDGRVLVGSTQEDVGFRKENTVEGLAELTDFSRKLCPALADLSLEQSWSGLRPGTVDGLPYLGRLPEIENAWIAAGHFRAGIQLSVATAVVMRSLILGEQPPVDVSSLGVQRC